MKPLALIAKARRSLHSRGILGTLNALAIYAAEPFGLLRPRRIRKRLADLMYDLRYGTETSAIVDTQHLGSQASSAHFANRYQATPEATFISILRNMRLDYSRYTFVDFGSGKGKCMLMASSFPFKRIVGVEFSAHLVSIARRNALKYRSRNQLCRQFEFFEGDAAEYPVSNEPTVYYFYNPFGSAVLEKVLQNAIKPIASESHKSYFVYFNPVHRGVFDATPRLRLVQCGPEHCIYRAE